MIQSRILESEIRDFILEYLQRRGVFVWRDKQNASKKFHGIGFPESRGCPDILGLLKSGQFLGIEVKKPKGVLSVEQHRFLDRIKQNGGIGIVVTCLEDLINQLKGVL